MTSYQIKLPQFEGPFDLLLFFIERDELDIYNIPIHRLIQDFLVYIHSQENLNIELSSEFILFVSTLMRVKARMLLPRKELDEQGNEIDPRQELIDKLLEYKRYKEAAATLAEMEAIRHLMVRRGNHHVQADENFRTADGPHPATPEQTRSYRCPLQLQHGGEPGTYPLRCAPG